MISLVYNCVNFVSTSFILHLFWRFSKDAWAGRYPIEMEKEETLTRNSSRNSDFDVEIAFQFCWDEPGIEREIRLMYAEERQRIQDEAAA